MKIKGKASKALIAASILAAGIYFGNETRTMIDEMNNHEQQIITQSIPHENDRTDIDNIIYYGDITNEIFNDFETEKLFTLFEGTKLYNLATDYNSSNLTVDVINNENTIVRGISQSNEWTLIELPNGEKKYVYNDDIAEIANYDRDDFGSVKYELTDNEEWTVNTDSYIYNKDGVCFGYISEKNRCIELARSGEYSFVISENGDYFFIKTSNLTLTKDYYTIIFAPKKLEFSPEQLDSRNIYYYLNTSDPYEDATYKAYFNNEKFIDNQEKPYYTLYKREEIYFRDGKMDSISFSEGTRVRVLRESENMAYVVLNDGSKGYVNKKSLGPCLVIDKDKFTPIIINRNQITNDWVQFYDLTGAFQKTLYPNEECVAIETDGTYTLVEFDDGTSGYIKSTSLIPSENQVSKYVYLKKDAVMYSKRIEDGKMVEIPNDYPVGEDVTYMFFIEGEYAYVGDYLLRDNFYVKLSDIDFNYNIEGVFSYAYVANNTTQNTKIDGSGQNYNVDDYDLYWIYYNCGEYSYVQSERNWKDGKFYIKTSDLVKIPGDFIYIDLDEQRMYCFDDNDGGRYTAEEWGTRSGKDSTPSHEGAFAIDWKAEDWEFTNFPGSRAKHWIPYNLYGEGIHDLIGDDEQNYGNEAYHKYGSHGCVRVPAEASEYVYNNYPVGTRVLVHKK